MSKNNQLKLIKYLRENDEFKGYKHRRHHKIVRKTNPIKQKIYKTRLLELTKE